MNKSLKVFKKKLFDHKRVLFGGVLVVLTLVVTTKATAAPARPSTGSRTAVRATATVLDPVLLRPVWLFNQSIAKPRPTPRPTSMTAGGLISVQGAGVSSVMLPPRPLPRSPYVPPLYR